MYSFNFYMDTIIVKEHVIEYVVWLEIITEIKVNFYVLGDSCLA